MSFLTPSEILADKAPFWRGSPTPTDEWLGISLLCIVCTSEAPTSMRNSFISSFILGSEAIPQLGLQRPLSPKDAFLHTLYILHKLQLCASFWLDILEMGKSTSGVWLHGIIIDLHSWPTARTLLPAGPLRQKRYFGIRGILIILEEFLEDLEDFVCSTPYNYCRSYCI